MFVLPLMGTYRTVTCSKRDLASVCIWRQVWRRLNVSGLAARSVRERGVNSFSMPRLYLYIMFLISADSLVSESNEFVALLDRFRVGRIIVSAKIASSISRLLSDKLSETISDVSKLGAGAIVWRSIEKREILQFLRSGVGDYGSWVLRRNLGVQVEHFGTGVVGGEKGRSMWPGTSTTLTGFSYL